MGNDLLKFDDDFDKFCFTLVTLSIVAIFIESSNAKPEELLRLCYSMLQWVLNIKLTTKILFMLANAIKSDSRKEN